MMMVMTLKSLENKLNSLSALISDEERLPSYAVLEAGGCTTGYSPPRSAIHRADSSAPSPGTNICRC